MLNQLSILSSQWCLVGNIVQRRPYGEGGQEQRSGTKHFSPGTKVYCLPARWGDGYEKIIVIGRHRGSKQYVTMVIESAWVTNWRAQVVYSPAVLHQLQAATQEPGRPNWRSQAEVEIYVTALKRYRTRPQSEPGPEE